MTEHTNSYREQYEKDKELGSIKDADACTAGGMRRHHSWMWKWDIAGNWTDFAVCTACGTEQLLKRDAYGKGGHG